MKKKYKISLYIIVILYLCISIFSFNFSNVYGTTKEDILNFVDSQEVCGDATLFNSYKATFTKLLKQKDLSSKELGIIYSYLQNAVGILNSHGICSLGDFNKLTEEEKNSVLNNLYAGASVIYSAPNLSSKNEDTGTNNTSKVVENNIDDVKNQSEENDTAISTSDTNNEKNDNNSKTNATINVEENTMDIYEDGVLVDKISLSTPKMTYTGGSVTYTIVIISVSIIFLTCLTIYLIVSKEYTMFMYVVKNILVSLAITSICVLCLVIIFGDNLEKAISLIQVLSFNENNIQSEAVLNENRSIQKYPSYGAKYATLSIENLGIKQDVYYGDTASILTLGIGHTTMYSMPTEGDVVVYSGHNKNDMLGKLQSIKEGDKIQVDTNYAKCIYEVCKIDILNDTEVDKFVKLNNTETLIIYTCYPFEKYIYTSQRYVVYSTLESIEWK